MGQHLGPTCTTCLFALHRIRSITYHWKLYIPVDKVLGGRTCPITVLKVNSLCIALK